MLRFRGNSAAGLIATALLAAGLHAQTVSISPANPSVQLGATKQFTATVTGLMNNTVTWFAGGIAGGNATAGTIDATGLYTAPAMMPGQNPVQIKALGSDGKTIGATYVLLLTAGPTITTVIPNPLPAGSYSITVKGSGFISGARIFNAGVQLVSTVTDANTITGSGYQGPATSTTIWVINSGSVASNVLIVPVSGSSGGSSGGGTGSQPLTVLPSTAAVVLGTTQQFSAGGATSWAATAGAITNAGLYTAPAVMPASPTVTITATGSSGQGTATVTLISNIPPAIQSLGAASLPLGVFSSTINGSGFIAQSVASLNGSSLVTSYVNANTLNVVGFAGSGGMQNVTVANGAIVSPPFAVQVGVVNPVMSAAAARRFLEQAAFGPSPADAAHLQTIGIPAWLNEQFGMGVISNFNGLGSQGGMSTRFLSNATNNPDQLRQRVSLALSNLLVTSINKVIWNSTEIPYQQMLMADAFTNYRQILGDVTLSPAMGQYLDMANNGKANATAGTVANENYAREVMQLFCIGDVLLNPDGTPQKDANGLFIPAYNQFTITEFARVFTGWTYANSPVVWGAYINPSAPMVPYPAMHDMGAKTLLNGYVSPANITPLQDLNNALDNMFNHPNTPPFISMQLIQHLVKSNPSPAYVKRVADVFTNNGQGVRGDMKAVIAAILTDAEARANDEGGNDLSSDGHLQEPALFLPGIVRAFGGVMGTGNYYNMDMIGMGEDLYNSPSVFNFFAPSYMVPGTSLVGGEFQIDTSNNAINRANVVANLFSAYSNPVQTYGPTTVDLTAYVPLANTPATLVRALDLTLTHGTMSAAMNQAVYNAILADNLGSLHRVQTGIFLILTSSYYNVWH
jgi:uncharacterized protein (DUF1800 family)